MQLYQIIQTDRQIFLQIYKGYKVRTNSQRCQKTEEISFLPICHTN